MIFKLQEEKMAGKTLIEILKRYEPDERTSRLLLSAQDTVVRANKESKLLEIQARFPKIIDKRTLYRIEDEIREAYQLNVVRILPKVGAFCELAPGKDGMIHISKMSEKRINSVEEVLAVGDTVKVEIIKIGDKGIDLKLLEKIEG